MVHIEIYGLCFTANILQNRAKMVKTKTKQKGGINRSGHSFNPGILALKKVKLVIVKQTKLFVKKLLFFKSYFYNSNFIENKNFNKKSLNLTNV